MAGNSFGTLFRITTFGESHGGGVGVIVDGCPPGLEINESDIQVELDRRKPGQSSITTPRKEEDRIKIYSGVFEGRTTGTPIMMMAMNKDQRSGDYDRMKQYYRPGHADYTYDMKYGMRDHRGSGRASARETLARVAAGTIAQKYLREKLGLEILSYVKQVGEIAMPSLNDKTAITRAAIESNIVRCPDPDTATQMISLIEQVKVEGDSIGGIIECIARGVPTGLGEPVFDKLHAVLGHAMLSINAVKGFEIGEGFGVIRYRGSTHNDPFVPSHPERSSSEIERSRPQIHTSTNHAGGILGGISTGQDIVFRVAFKPVSTIMIPQETVKTNGERATLTNEGRHDPCVLPRAVPIVDAMCALVLMDQLLIQRSMHAPSYSF
jgi:chorismate synthase